MRHGSGVKVVQDKAYCGRCCGISRVPKSEEINILM